MKKDSVTVKERIHSDLFMPPHVADKLVALIAGEWKPDASQIETLTTHLTECSYCRTTLIVLRPVVQEYEKPSGKADTFIDGLFAQFVNIHHEIESQGYEQMGAYAEMIIAKREKEADKQFPGLAEHIKSCLSCRTILKELLDFLEESGKKY